MPPRAAAGVTARTGLRRRLQQRLISLLCPHCQSSTSAYGKPLSKHETSRPLSTQRRRYQSTQAVPTQHQAPDNGPPQSVRTRPSPIELKQAFHDLRKYARNYVNISQLELALRGLDQERGQEVIRIVFVGLSTRGRSTGKVRELVRILLADPLKQEEEWERELVGQQDARPILIRIGNELAHDSITHVHNRMVKEVVVDSPTLHNHRLEILVLDKDLVLDSSMTRNSTADAILIPSVDIPTSYSGRYTQVTTPVHRAMVIGSGIHGAATLLNASIPLDVDIISTTIDSRDPDLRESDDLPFSVVDVDLAGRALSSFRSSVDNALSYEHDWFRSGVPTLLEWLKSGTADGPTTKPALRNLLRGVLEGTQQRITQARSIQLSTLLSAQTPANTTNSLRSSLTSWAERAHMELRDQLDMAFASRRWRKIGWWKLFWRVDDVSMIASDMLHQRFLRTSEQEVIYLAGKIAEAGIFNGRSSDAVATTVTRRNVPETALAEFSASDTDASTLKFSDLMDQPSDDSDVTVLQKSPWPLHIPTTRSFLITDTVPALQALAQRLVLQTITTSSFASIFSALIYVSTLETSVYEAGTVAALGTVWSLRRLQTRWETARAYFEGEVREDGRKAVRSTESSISNVLMQPVVGETDLVGGADFEAAERAVMSAEEALKNIEP